MSLSSCDTTNMSVHLIQLSSKCIKASIHALKLSHDCLEGHITHRRRRMSRGGWNGRGWRIHRLNLWPLWSKLGLVPSNKRRAIGTYDHKVRRLRNRDRKMANDLHDSRREKELITSCPIPIDIDKRENEVRRKVYREVLDEG